MVLAMLVGGACSEPVSDAPPLRVMTWNIKGAQLASTERIAAQIREVDPDVVAMQELFFDAEWNGHVDVSAELTRLTGMHGANLVTLEHEGPFGFEIAGQMVLTREPVELEPLVLESGRRIGAKFVFREKTFVMAHLPTELDDRTEGLALIAQESWNVLLGDLNAVDVSGLSATQSECGLSFPSQKPDRRIDWVLTRGEDAGTCATVSTTASDHLPMVTWFGDGEPMAPVSEIDGTLFDINAPDFSAAAVTRAAFVDRSTLDQLGLPTPITVDATINGLPLCEMTPPGVYAPCAAATSGAVLVTLGGGASLQGTPTMGERATLVSVDSVDGGARFTPFESLPTTLPDGYTTPVPVQPLNRRVDVSVMGSTTLSVSVFREVWTGSSFEPMAQTFANVPITAKDMFDELALTRLKVSVPGSMFDRPGMYFIVSTPMSSGTVTALGSRSGVLIGTGQVTRFWVE
jgi:endonuclease/exonuclease/phosphatase family metal-dependent hydrolase